MFFTFEREPFGWVHPMYRRPHHHHPVALLRDWDNFVGPALDTVDSLNQILQLAQSEPRLVQSLASQQEAARANKFEIKMDVTQFAPEEIDVKMVDNSVVIEGKHEEKKDEHGYVSRHFVRRYQLPADVKPEAVTCNLSSDGILSVSAPRMIENKAAPNQRSVPIQFTGHPSISNEDKSREKTNEAKLT